MATEPKSSGERLRMFTVQAGDCIEWTGHRDKNGYGAMTIAQQPVRTHRLAWELAHGPIPPGMFVLHRCDNPPCCNVEHLFLGTPGDNMQDMAQKGRAGGGRPRSKVTDEQAAEIRRRHVRGLNSHQRGNAAELAAEFGITSGHVNAIVRGERCVA